eukprot:SAG11_NODE_6194_length_1367_cov_0.851852_1_plen_167_part_00
MPWYSTAFYIYLGIYKKKLLSRYLLNLVLNLVGTRVVNTHDQVAINIVVDVTYQLTTQIEAVGCSCHLGMFCSVHHVWIEDGTALCSALEQASRQESSHCLSQRTAASWRYLFVYVGTRRAEISCKIRLYLRRVCMSGDFSLCAPCTKRCAVGACALEGYELLMTY